MQNIRVRLWQRDHFKTIPKEYIGTRCSHLCMSTDQDGFTIFSLDSSEGKIVQMSTGLRDKNGKEIFEGDILKEEWDTPERHMIFKSMICFGEYTDGEGFPNLGFYTYWSLNDSPWSSAGNIHSNKRWEVIGNIFENPELCPT